MIHSCSFDLQAREKPPGILFEDIGPVLSGKKLDGVEQGLDVVEALAGLRIRGRSRARILGAEKNAVAAHHSNQHLQRLLRMQARIVIKHLQAAVELLHRAAALHDVIRLPAPDLVRDGTPSVRDDDLQLRKILEDLRVDQRQDRQAFLADEVLAVAFAAVFAAARMYEPGDIELDHLFPERIPILVRESGRAVIAFAGIGIDQRADETEFLDAALHLAETPRHGLARGLRKRAHALKTFGKRGHLLRDVVVIGDGPRLHQLDRFLGMHQLERPRRNELHVGADGIHNAQIALRIGMIANPFVGESFRREAMRPAGGHQDGLPLIQLRRGANVRVDIDDHDWIPFHADHGEDLALNQHGAGKIGGLKRVARRPRVRVRKHLQPSLVEMRALRAVLHPDVHFHNVLGPAAGDLQDLADGREHLLALGFDSVGKFSGIRLFARTLRS